MKSHSFPSYLIEYNSFWNPFSEVFLQGKAFADESHFLTQCASVGLLSKNKRAMIDHNVLQAYGAKRVSVQREDFIFREGEEAQYYFQLVQGSIKMVTNSSEGQEFIQGVFRTNDSFGEPPLFCSFPYPSSAVALEATSVFKLSKANFFTLLRENFDIHLKLNQVLCHRLRYKAMVLTEISFYNPTHRIDSLLRYFKQQSLESENCLVGRDSQYVIPYTRQQLADMTGLRVETVIRTVKKLEDEGKLKIVGRKITV
jgi:CRP/FNR family transcriptional regulator, cyclic AMP receptor protein